MSKSKLLGGSIALTIALLGMGYRFPALSIVPLAAAASLSKLGNLAPFRTIAQDAATLVDQGKLDEAKVRIKDLETSWDEAEAGLKPRAAPQWHVVDEALDRVLSALRESRTDAARCKQALVDLLDAFDKASG